MEQTPPAFEERAVIASSIPTRLLNVFAAPGEVFEEVKSAPVQHWNWLAPALIAVVVGWIGSWIVFGQPAIQQQMRELSTYAIEKQIEKGKMSEQQAEQMRQAAEKFGAIGQKISAYAAPVFVAFISPFFWGFIIWLFGNKVLKGDFRFFKGLEVAGLANTIGILEGIVRALLIVTMGSVFASPSLVLLVKEFNPQNPVHGLLGAVNIMTFWLLALRSLGLAKLSNASFTKAACCIFGVWASYTLFFIALGFAAQKAFGQ